MLKAVVYTSNTGYTAQYAEMLGKQTGLPVYALKDAPSRLADASEVIYLGWLMASKIKGLDAARKRYTVAAVCGVGMGATGTQIPEARKANALPESLPLFTLQGGFDIKKLHGIYRLMMAVMAKTVGKAAAKKADPTPEEKDMLDMLQNGGSRVKEENLAGVMEWYRGLEK